MSAPPPSSGSHFLAAIAEAERRGVEGLGRKAVALERLLHISREISHLDPATVLRRILRHVLELTGCRRGAVLLLDGDAGLRTELAEGLEQGELASEGFAVSRSTVERALATGDVIVIEDVPRSAEREQGSVVALGLKALAAVPLVVHGRRLGALYLDTDSTDHDVRQLDVSLLAAFGSQAAVALENAQLFQRLQEDYVLLRRTVEQSFRFDNLLYASARMHQVCEAIRQVAASQVTVLITGETGVGKELVARAIHFNGPRKGRRFLSQNAGALADNLLESELFGHRRGAFSGALENKVGLFEAADGGTVFLDEIGEASPALQVRLLRLLETGTFRRVGETADRRADVRIVAATNRDLAVEVAAGRFRADLYYRLSVFPIAVPPLRDRREDIEVLVRHFVERFNRELGRRVERIPATTLAALSARDWPGNVRELMNTVQRLVLLSPGENLQAPGEDPAASLPAAAAPPQSTGASPTPEPSPAPESPPGLIAPLIDVEREHLRRALAAAGGNLSQAARLLGLKRGTLRWRLRKLGIEA